MENIVRTAIGRLANHIADNARNSAREEAVIRKVMDRVERPMLLRGPVAEVRAAVRRDLLAAAELDPPVED
jgi:hypothetical protein